MENDDRQIGRVLSRREALTFLGAAGTATLLSACVALPNGGPSASTGASVEAVATTNAGLSPGCVVRPELTEGPVFAEINSPA